MFNAALLAALSVTATFTRPDGTTYSRALDGSAGAEGSRTYTVSKSEIVACKTVALAVDDCDGRTGEEGFVLYDRGLLTHFRERNFRVGRMPHWLPNHYVAMSTPRKSYIGIVDSLEFEMHVRADAKDGVWRAWVEWHVPEIIDGAYEDIVYTVYELPASAGYVPMAKVYRRHAERKNPDLKPIAEREKTQPSLAKLRKSFALRQICARKWPRTTNATSTRDASYNVDFNETNEPPVQLVKSFADTLAELKAMKAAGLDDVALCLAGWQTGGYDGRCPAAFPVEGVAGGERELRRLIAGAKELGYLIDAHNNYTDSFTCSPEWRDGDVASTKPDGSLCVNHDWWDGGRPYDTCLKAIAGTLVYRDLKRCHDIGFDGCAYIDVFSAAWPYRCSNPRHPATRRDTARLQIEIAKFCRQLNGGFASECCFDHMLPYVDYINYAQPYMRTIRRFSKQGKRYQADELVPFFELAFHDVVLSNPDKVTQGVPVGADRLMLWEFGGRPIDYFWERSDIPALKDLYDEFLKLRHLQGVEMTDHCRFPNGVARTTFANGQRLYLNYNPCTEQVADGVRVPALDWVLK